MEKCFLTNGGNFLRSFETALIGTNGVGAKRFYFQKPNGEFIREVSDSEAEYLLENCLEVDVRFPPAQPNFLPSWHFIKSVQVIQDNSNYRWETCRNGGDYSFQTYHDWYVAKYPRGIWKFCFVERYSTSAEFEFDELDGSFQQGLGCLTLSNVERGELYYQSLLGIEWKNEEKHYTSSEVLEKIANMSSFSDLWNEMFKYIPSRWDEEEGFVKKALSFSDKKEILARMKEVSAPSKLKVWLCGKRTINGR